MKVHNTNHQVEDLINEARNEKPLMPLKEVESIISAAKYTPAIAVKGLHIGINSLIVISGIVVSSFLAYMALKVDSIQVPATASPEIVAEQPVDPSTQLVNQKVTNQTEKTAQKNTTPAKLKREDLVRPAPRTENLTASTKTLLANEEAIPVNEPAAITVPKKILSGQFMITFYYNEQKVEMKVAGENITELAVNQKVIPEAKYDDYDDVIAEGRNYLMGEHAKDVNSLQLISFFDSQLHADKVLNGDSHYVFELGSDQLLINNASLSYDLFRKYKKLYESKTGRVITEGSTYRYEKGN